MVYYIRFLRVPQVKLEADGRGKDRISRITAVLTVTTDLGESYFPEDLELNVRLVNNEDRGALPIHWRVYWRKNTHVTKLDLRHRNGGSRQIMYLHVSTPATDETWVKYAQIPGVLDVYSLGFQLHMDCSAPDYAERRLRLTNTTTITIKEAIGESIARHIWDGAIGCLELFKHTLLLTDSIIMMKQLHQLLFIGSACRGIKAVELGSGCGVAGIALAQIVAGTSVLLTDLEEAQDIISHNIKSTRLPRGSSLQQEVLDWDKPLSPDGSHHSVDLLIICECIYNADSCPTLIRVIQQFIALSPTMKTLVITKKRHDSERVFFDLMAKAGIQMLEQCFVPLPHIVTDLDHERQQAEIYLFGADLDVMSPIEPFRLEPHNAHPGPLYPDLGLPNIQQEPFNTNPRPHIPSLGNLDTNPEPANTILEPLNTNANPSIPDLGHLNTNQEPRPDHGGGPPARLKAKVRRRKSRKSG